MIQVRCYILPLHRIASQESSKKKLYTKQNHTLKKMTDDEIDTTWAVQALQKRARIADIDTSAVSFFNKLRDSPDNTKFRMFFEYGPVNICNALGYLELIKLGNVNDYYIEFSVLKTEFLPQRDWGAMVLHSKDKYKGAVDKVVIRTKEEDQIGYMRPYASTERLLFVCDVTYFPEEVIDRLKNTAKLVQDLHSPANIHRVEFKRLDDLCTQANDDYNAARDIRTEDRKEKMKFAKAVLEAADDDVEEQRNKILSIYKEIVPSLEEVVQRAM